MVKLGLQNNNFVKLSMMELDKNEWTRTRKVLDLHQDHLIKVSNGEISPAQWVPDEYKLNSTCNLLLLCGADLLESFSIPGLWEDDDVSYNFDYILLLLIKSI